MKIKYFIPITILMTLVVSGCAIKNASSSRDGGIFKSTDFGENWKQKATVEPATNNVKSIGDFNTSFIVFDPKEKNIIYLITLGQGIYKSENSGEKWSQTTLNSGSYRSLSIDSLNNKVVYTTDGTKILKTVDGMGNWHQIYIENRPKQSIVSLIVDHDNSNIIYAATTSGLIKSYDYGSSWKLLDWQEPNISHLYQSTKNNNTLYALTNRGIYKSIDGALEWEVISEDLIEYKGAEKIHWLSFDPRTEYIYIGTAYGIIRSLDGGNSWTPIPTLFDFKKISIKALVFNPNDIDEIIFSVNNILHKTDNGGRTWKTLKSVPTTRIINYLAADPYHDDVVLLGTYKPKK